MCRVRSANLAAKTGQFPGKVGAISEIAPSGPGADLEDRELPSTRGKCATTFGERGKTALRMTALYT
jgi:hypothetical protein